MSFQKHCCTRIAERLLPNRPVALIACILPGSITLAADPKPPHPNPADPVNYIEWINETFGGNVAENAAELYREALERLDAFAIDWDGTLDGPWSDDENKEVVRWLEANAKALQRFRRAASKGDCFFLYEAPKSRGDPRLDCWLVRVEFPHLGAQREAVKALIADGYRAWRGGDQRRLVESALIALRSAHHFDGAVTALERLVGISCAAFGYRALRVAVALCDDPDSLAVEILPRFTAADPPFAPLDRAYLGERLYNWDTCQRLYTTSEGRGLAAVYGPLLMQFEELGFSELYGELDTEALAQIGYRPMLREINAFFDAVDEWNRTPYHVGAKQKEQLEVLLNDATSPLLKGLGSAHRLRVIFERAATDRRATHLIVHLFAYREKKGRFPRILSQLDAPDLDELRLDSFSGRDLVYKRKGKDFTLYSIGENLEDDDGRAGEGRTDGDYVYWPVHPR